VWTARLYYIPAVDLDEHVRLFNAAVGTGNWGSFVEQFSDDAVLEFVGPPVGPFKGKAAIASAYATSPPDDGIQLDGTATTGGNEPVMRSWPARPR
jgi:steroid delta-isomerase